MKRDGIMIDQRTIPMSEVAWLLQAHGFSDEFWSALKHKMRSKGFRYSRGQDKGEACCHYVQGDLLIHELWLTGGK